MEQRGITPTDVLTVLGHPTHGPEPGSRGTLVVEARQALERAVIA